MKSEGLNAAKTMGKVLFETKNLTKAYPGVVALDGASLQFHAGEVHALVGENGAGKSTLIKLMSGYETPDAGTLCVDGEEFASFTPASAIAHGVGTVYQDAMLVPELSVAENVFLGSFPGHCAVLDRKELLLRASALLDSLGASIDPTASVASLGPSQAQFVAVAKAVATNARLIILDEPTAALTDADADRLFDLVGRLKESGKAIVYITHRLSEVFRLADTVTVMRDGRIVAQDDPANITRDELVSLIVGRPIDKIFPSRSNHAGDVRMAINGLSGPGVRDVSFDVYAGEILGIAGLVGSGIDVLGRLLFGAEAATAGRIDFEGKQVSFASPADAVACGIGYVPADRKGQGALLDLSVGQNISLASLKKLSNRGVVDARREKSLTESFIDGLKIKVSNINQRLSSLSGGNQQKVVLSKWLATDSRLLVLEEPTQGVDVGARYEIYRLMRNLTAEGMSIVVLSSDVEELVGIADRILVMHDGTVAGVLESPESFSAKTIMGYASGLVA